MTREEEIRQAGISYTYRNRPMCIGGGVFSEMIDEMNRNLAFEEGAKWADKTMLDRACEWLELRISVDVPVETNENGEPLADSLFDRQMKRAKLAEEFITDFRQAMEGKQ